MQNHMIKRRGQPVCSIQHHIPGMGPGWVPVSSSRSQTA
jgi:hypothetical protein